MKDKIVWILSGFFIWLSCVTMIGAKKLGFDPAASIATSADGKFVYIIGDDTDSYYRSTNYGKTFYNLSLEP